MVLTIPGNPIPLKRARSFIKRGTIHHYDSQATQKRKIATFIRYKTQATKLQGPINCSIHFHLKRPANHFRSGKYKHILKNNAPQFPTSTPDIDNLIKFYLDAMNSIAYEDDRQIVSISAGKLYAEKGKERTVISLDTI
jgi:Holliday junction resolvase RusA-like endonuclease